MSARRPPAGSLHHQVEIQAPVAGADANGFPLKGWLTVATARASVEPLSGRELRDARQVEERTSHRVRMDPAEFPGLTANHRLRFVKHLLDGTTQERVLNLLSGRDLEERGFVFEILAEERVEVSP